MTTKAQRLLDRIEDAGYTPKVGDVLRHRTRKGKWTVVGIGRPSSMHSATHVALLQDYIHSDWSTEIYAIENWGYAGSGTENFYLDDVGQHDHFIWGGFSPADSGRAYVLQKRAAGAILIAGCRRFTTYAQAARHWRPSGCSSNWHEKRLIAKELFAQARRRGWMKVKRQPPVKKARAKK